MKIYAIILAYRSTISCILIKYFPRYMCIAKIDVIYIINYINAKHT